MKPHPLADQCEWRRLKNGSISLRDKKFKHNGVVASITSNGQGFISVGRYGQYVQMPNDWPIRIEGMQISLAIAVDNAVCRYWNLTEPTHSLPIPEESNGTHH